MTAIAPTELLKLADELKRAIDQVPGINQQNLIVRAEKAIRQAASVERADTSKLGSSEPLGPQYDGTTMDNQKLHAGPGGGMTPAHHNVERAENIYADYSKLLSEVADWEARAIVAENKLGERAEVAGEAMATKKTYLKPFRTIVELDARYADRIRDLLNTSPPRSEGVRGSEVQSESALIGTSPVAVELMQRVWDNRYWDRDEFGTFQQTLNEVVDWLAALDALPSVERSPRAAQSPDQFEITRLSGLLADAQKIIAEYKASTIATAREGLAQEAQQPSLNVIQFVTLLEILEECAEHVPHELEARIKNVLGYHTDHDTASTLPSADRPSFNQKTRCEECNLLAPCADPNCPNAAVPSTPSSAEGGGGK